MIFAGYGGTDVDEKNNKMKEFIDANPGIKSRINSTFYFPSYTAPEMAVRPEHYLKKSLSRWQNGSWAAKTVNKKIPLAKKP